MPLQISRTVNNVLDKEMILSIQRQYYSTKQDSRKNESYSYKF